MDDARKVAEGLTDKWLSNPNEVHKQPPYRAHSFDDDGRYWVVGTTRVSVLHGCHGEKAIADMWAGLLNATPAVRAILEETRNG